MKYKGEPTKGLEFYKLLNQSEEFTSELGRVALASGRLEAELVCFLIENEIPGNYRKATLGALIGIVKNTELLSRNEISVFERISKRRNYLTHNIYALFAEQIDETLLEREGLLDSDVLLYYERTWQLALDLNELSELIKTKLSS
jgi:hypothetical protein